METDYLKFLLRKQLVAAHAGREVEASDISPVLYEFQRDLVQWAMRQGRAAIFADCGLGKTLIQLEWARLVGGRVLIVAPLCVAEQTIAQGGSPVLQSMPARKPEYAEMTILGSIRKALQQHGDHEFLHVDEIVKEIYLPISDNDQFYRVKRTVVSETIRGMKKHLFRRHPMKANTFGLGLEPRSVGAAA